MQETHIKVATPCLTSEVSSFSKAPCLTSRGLSLQNTEKDKSVLIITDVIIAFRNKRSMTLWKKNKITQKGKRDF